MRFDFHTAEAAEIPHVKVYNTETEETWGIFYINKQQPVDDAERLAEKLVDVLNKRHN